ncbi:MAG: hypothetical protein NG784_09500 [Candidatus Jettenia sp.]|nr:hypothetical protein [Candidatus Jettenia sp.]
MAMHMYANENSEIFPTGGATGSKASDSDDATKERYSLGKLFDSYITDRKIFRCPSDAGVTEADVLSLGTLTTFIISTCSYGYDDNHTPADDPGVAIAADAKGNGSTLSDNHKEKGQNVLYIDGHVEWKGTPNCGWYGTSTSGFFGYDDIYNDTGTGTTDTYIQQ